MSTSYQPPRTIVGVSLGFLVAIAFSYANATADAAQRAEMTQHTITIQSSQIHYLEAGARVAGTPSVLLLHGARFSSQTWAELGTLEVLARAGHHVVALDLPGFGESTGEPPADRSEFLDLLLGELDIHTVALLAPSMSGSYAIPFLLEHPERVSHFLPVAPVSIMDNLERLRAVDVPTLALWGGNDQVVPVEIGRALASAMPNAELRIFAGAPHPCYLEATMEFHDAVLDFLER
jgi:pimeloyl-ACP methyl ester carboxylesterase